MGHTNSTANLALPQFIGTDKPTWLSDVNGAFAAIDAYAGTNDAALAITDAKADTAISDAAGAVTTAGNASTTAGNAAATATAANTVAGNALTVANGINSKVGVLTDLHTTDKSTVVNAINEVKDSEGDLASLTTSDKTSLVNAINEVAQGGGGSGDTFTTIWTNPDTSQNVASGTVATISDSATYKAFILAVGDSTTAADKITSSVIKSGDSVHAYVIGVGNFYERTVTVTQSGSSIVISATDGTQDGYVSSSPATVNNMLIPVALYGIK